MQPQAARPVAAPQHYSPPSARELRAQSVQRLQVGLFGLAAMLLLVALANIIMDKALKSGAGEPASTEATATPTRATGDPLADIGVQPAAEAGKATRQPSPGR